MLFQVLNNIFDIPEDYIVAFIHGQTLLSPLLILVEELGVPLPVPGDVVVAYAGYQASLGKITYPIVFIDFLLAVIVGSSVLYFISRVVGEKVLLKLGRFIHLGEDKLKTVEKKFKKYGPLVIIIGRHIPGFRVPVTVFSGISKVPYPTFLISTIISVVFWIYFYLSLGVRLGPKTIHLVHAHRGYFLFALVPIIIILGCIIFLRKKK